MKFKRKPQLIHFLIAAIVVLLPVLAVLQYYWIGEISKREKEHLRRTFETSALNFSMNFEQKISSLLHYFFIRDTSISDDNLNSYFFQKLKLWRNESDANILKKIYIIDLNNNPIYWLLNEKTDELEKTENLNIPNINDDTIISFAENISKHRPNILMGKFELLMLPVRIRHNDKRFLIIELNSDTIINKYIKNGIESFFPSKEELNLIVAIFNPKDSLIFSNAPDYIKNYQKWEEFSLPFGMMKPFNMERNLKERFHNLVPALGRTEPPKEKDDDGFKPAKEFKDDFSPWRLSVGFKSGTLDNEIAVIRFKNMAISFTILLLLAFVIFFIIYTQGKAKKLANQQLQFVAGISHELRTPLTVIRTASENISDGIIDQKKTKLYGDLIRKQTDRLWEMIENTLSFAGIHSNKQIYNFKPLNVYSVITKVLSHTLFINQGKEINIENNISEDLPNIFADETTLQTAFQNLIINAVKFSNDNAVVKIGGEYDSKKKIISVSIEDNGIGISSKDLPKIFEPFFRSNSVIDSGINGNGIGLALVKQIIENHQAKIIVSSRLNFGTTFIIQFPVK